MARKPIDRRPRLEIASQYAGEMIYVSKKLYDGILKKVTVTKLCPVGGSGGKVIIEYQSKHGRSHGVLILNDIGPMPPTKGA